MNDERRPDECSNDGRLAPERLDVDPEVMRRLGYRIIDHLVAHLDGLPDQPAAQPTDPEAMLAKLSEPLPTAPTDPESVLARLERDVLPAMAHVQHPRFFAFVPGPSNSISVLADALAAGLNVFAGTWYAGPGALALEHTTIDWLRQICGLPASAGGLLVSGGSMANLTALAAARVDRFGGHDMRKAQRARIYTGDQTHTAVTRAAHVLGFGSDQVVSLETDAAFRISPNALAAAIRADRRAGHEPFAIVANAGTTNTGAVDPLRALASLARDEELWFHIDGAYGAPARMTARGRHLLDGIEEADSIALDPHKWLFQPFEIGCVLMRDAQALERAFAVQPAYLRDVSRAVANPADQGVQLTRSFRSLKLWMTFQVFGADAIRAAIDRGLDLAEKAEAILRGAGCWEIVTPASMAVVTFRYRRAGLDPEAIDQLQSDILEQLLRDGTAVVSSTVLGGQTVLRLCTINPRTTHADLQRTIDRLGELAIAHGPSRQPRG